MESQKTFVIIYINTFPFFIQRAVVVCFYKLLTKVSDTSAYYHIHYIRTARFGSQAVRSIDCIAHSFPQVCLQGKNVHRTNTNTSWARRPQRGRGASLVVEVGEIPGKARLRQG